MTTVKVSKSVYARPMHMNSVARAIMRFPQNTLIVRGLPGCGKTALLALIAEMNGDKWRRPGDYYPDDKYCYVYIACNDLQPGDLTSKIPVIAKGCITEMHNDILCVADSRPKVYMFDEVLKIPRTCKGMVTSMLNDRIYGNALPMAEGTRVFGTSNTALDNIGDHMGSHERTRVTEVTMMPPDAPTWLAWAAKKGINPLMQAVVAINPAMLETYITLDRASLDANPYANNPYRSDQAGFVTHRGLERASYFLDDRPHTSDEDVLTLVAGTIGEPAASLVQQAMHMEKEIIDPAVIFANPEAAPIPTSDICLMITLFKSPAAIHTQDELSAYVRYVERLPSNLMQASWALSIMRHPKVDKLAHRNSFFNKWKAQFDKYFF
jgi:hypothetical protein